MENCCICGGVFEDENSFSVLTQKGCDTINQLNSSLGAEPAGKVHRKCRLDLIRPKKSSSTPDDEVSKDTVRCRSTELKFNYSEHCLFCGQSAKYKGKRKGFDVIPVRTMEFQETILKTCRERNDDWSQTVLGCLEYLRDLHAADAVYHQTCSINFRTGKNIPKQCSSDLDNDAKRCKTQGRPVDTVKSSAFMEVVQYLLENEEEQLTVADLTEKMEEYLEGTEEDAYSVVYMKRRLQEHFGDRIVITSTKKRPNVVTFKHTVASIVHEFYVQPRCHDLKEEESRIVEAAAKLVKREIMSKDVSTENFPESAPMSSVDTALEFVPTVLQTFLRTLFSGKDVSLKLASLGQAIVQATRPRAFYSTTTAWAWCSDAPPLCFKVPH